MSSINGRHCPAKYACANRWTCPHAPHPDNGATYQIFRDGENGGYWQHAFRDDLDHLRRQADGNTRSTIQKVTVTSPSAWTSTSETRQHISQNPSEDRYEVQFHAEYDYSVLDRDYQVISLDDSIVEELLVQDLQQSLDDLQDGEDDNGYDCKPVKVHSYYDGKGGLNVSDLLFYGAFSLVNPMDEIIDPDTGEKIERRSGTEKVTGRLGRSRWCPDYKSPKKAEMLVYDMYHENLGFVKAQIPVKTYFVSAGMEWRGLKKAKRVPKKGRNPFNKAHCESSRAHKTFYWLFAEWSDTLEDIRVEYVRAKRECASPEKLRSILQRGIKHKANKPELWCQCWIEQGTKLVPSGERSNVLFKKEEKWVPAQAVDLADVSRRIRVAKRGKDGKWVRYKVYVKTLRFLSKEEELAKSMNLLDF